LGFVHGVMNTDNMALSGEGIDYGPCAFLDVHRAAAVFSSIDRGGRYAYGNQPGIALWNLSRFAETLLPLIDPDDPDASVEAAPPPSRAMKATTSTPGRGAWPPSSASPWTPRPRPASARPRTSNPAPHPWRPQPHPAIPTILRPSAPSARSCWSCSNPRPSTTPASSGP